MGYYHDFHYNDYSTGPEDDYYEPDLSYMSLCLICANLYENGCLKYPKMTDRMFGRKKKCKHYYDINKVPIPDDYYYYGGEE